MPKLFRAPTAALAALILALCASAGSAQSEPVADAADTSMDDFEPPPVRRHPHFKSDIWLPLPSIILPGFGQYFQGDWTGGVYTLSTASESDKVFSSK